ncbi:MAG TPA: cytochrome D1 domain-containing protein, partial [Thauera sp.]|nr:cytochrome D1 domain-containing protein [Thauera sp.]
MSSLRAVIYGVAACAVVLPAAAAEGAPPAAALPVAALYAQHCAECHAPDRLGSMGPALLPDNLARLRKPDALKVVAEGRTATQMPGFAAQLNKDEIAALVDLIYSPVEPPPRWSDDNIRASRIEHVDPATLSDKPVFDADPLNIFLVVEGGDHHVSVLDGDKLEPIFRFQSRFALHGGPKFAAGGRYVFFGSRDGWITKFDLWNLKVVAEVRAGINTRNVAVSPDGNHVAVANYLPNSLVLLDGDLNLIKTLAATDRDGKKSSRVSAVYDATPRQS